MARDPRLADDNRARQIWQAIACVIATVTIFSVAQELTYPLLALILERQDTSSFLVGLSAAMTPLGLMVAAPLLPALARRIGRGTLLVACILASAALLVIIAAVPDVIVWMPLRFLLGAAMGSLYVVGETALLQIAPESHRARVLGAYTGITNLGYAAGPLIVAVGGSEGATPFASAVTILFIGLVPLLLARRAIHRIEAGRQERASILRFVAKAPVVLVAYAATTLFDNALMTLFPVYGLRHGLSEAMTSTMLTMILVGGVALQYPIGWFADRISRTAMLYACTVLILAACLAVPMALHAGPPVWLLAFLWGGAVFGLQTLIMTEIASRFAGGMLNAGNATLGLTWGISAIVGVPLAGVAMDALGPDGLMVTVGGAFALALLLLPFDRRAAGAGRPT